MYVVHRDGRKSEVSFDKIRDHVKKLKEYPTKLNVNDIEISKMVCSTITDGITTSQLNEYASQYSASKTTYHHDYSKLAARIRIANYHKNTINVFSDLIEVLYNHINPLTNERSPLISEKLYNIVQKNKTIIDNSINYIRDYNHDYFGFNTLYKSYLLKINGEPVERPQHMFMRVALGIHGESITKAIETYNLLSEGFIMHATPTLFNSGTPNNTLASCYLITSKEDSIEGIYDTLKTCAVISKSAGGIGLDVNDIRCRGSYIKGTNGISNGLVPMLKVFNETSRYVDQGGGKRKGAFAIYIEPWHADIIDFLKLKKQSTKEELRAQDLFYGLWIPDLFMERLNNKEDWTLFDPKLVPDLHELYGDEFKEAYLRYESEGKGIKTIAAVDLMTKIIENQVETGTPYMLYKDHINKKSNQKNLGTIKLSNLCAEIVEYTSNDEIAMCNLCTIALPKFVENGEFNYEKLFEITKKVTNNLNKVLDISRYPVIEAKLSNLRHRPIGIGVQGLADAFMKLNLPFGSDLARKINKKIFETISFGYNTESMLLAKERGEKINELKKLMVEDKDADALKKMKLLENELYPDGLYECGENIEFDGKLKLIVEKELTRTECIGAYYSFEGSPLSQGKFQHDLWEENGYEINLSGLWDWDSLRNEVMTYGTRNSLGLSCQPTASSAQILGNNETMEPITSNLQTRSVQSGQFQIINKYLINDLTELGLWNNKMRLELIRNRGSIKNIEGIPDELKMKHKTVWEIKNKTIIEMAADRAIFIDQTQSMNLFMPVPSFKKIRAMHIYAWKKGLKTGMYYLRSLPATHAQQFTVDVEKKDEMTPAQICSIENKDDCIMCQ